MITLTVPIPDRCLSPNSRAHWSRKAKATREARLRRLLSGQLKAMREAGIKPPQWDLAETRVTFYWPTAHRRDADNAMRRMKPMRDGLEDAGVVADDAGLIHWPATMRKDADNPRAEITITPTPA